MLEVKKSAHYSVTEDITRDKLPTSCSKKIEKGICGVCSEVNEGSRNSTALRKSDTRYALKKPHGPAKRCIKGCCVPLSSS